MTDKNELKRLAEAATPQDFDSAETKSGNGYIECPHCSGEGEVELEAEYCNYDNVAIGVQFYGIGNEFGAAEAFYRAANPAAVLALIAEIDQLQRIHMRYSESACRLGDALKIEEDDQCMPEVESAAFELIVERDKLKAENEVLRIALKDIRENSTDISACECAADALVDSLNIKGDK